MKSIYKKIGQLFMIGVDGTEPTNELISYLKEYNFGGLIIFKRNINNLEQIGNFIEEIRSKTSYLFVAVDEEGGIVSRFKGIFTELPSNAVLGDYFKATSDISLIEKLAGILSTELKQVGINWNFAPVMDVNTNIYNPVIGKRAYSSEEKIVSMLGSIFIKTFQENLILATAKHFPGHGDTSIDSHESLPIIQHNDERLREIELRPFQAAIQAKVASIMIGHIKLPSLDAQFPCSMSQFFITKLLKNQLKFRGLVISDDLEMGALTKTYQIDECACQAVKAGSDMVMICQKRENQEAAVKGVIRTVENDYITNDMIEKKYQKIMLYKKSFLKEAFKFDLKAARDTINSAASLESVRQLKNFRN